MARDKETTTSDRNLSAPLSESGATERFVARLFPRLQRKDFLFRVETESGLVHCRWFLVSFLSFKNAPFEPKSLSPRSSTFPVDVEAAGWDDHFIFKGFSTITSFSMPSKKDVRK